MEHILDYNADVVFFSETWMEAVRNDITAIMKSHGYKLLHNRRRDREKELGGGVGIMLKALMIHKQISSKQFTSFEHTIVNIQVNGNSKLTLITIYRLQFIATNIFLDEFIEFLEMLSTSTENFVLSGDINLHLETDEHYAVCLKEIFVMFNLVQYVAFPTHKLGHTLDVVIARYDSPSICELTSNNVHLSDHFMVNFKVEVTSSKHETKTVMYRDLNSVNNEQFSTEVKQIYETVPPGNMKDKALAYNTVMKEIADTHAPLKRKEIKIVPSAPWFDSEYKELRKSRRKAEKKYKKSGLPEDRIKFINLRKQTTNLAFNKKRQHYSEKINECGKNGKSLYTCVNKLLDIKQDMVLPSHSSGVELANQFKIYFKEKISDIRKSFPLKANQTFDASTFNNGSVLDVFEPASEDEIRSIILTYGVKCSPEDPIPVQLLNRNLDVFIPIWLDLVNLSLSQGSMDGLKNAILTPLIKELDDLIDTDILKNYRPISNLLFLGKLIERVVGIRLDSHMERNNLHCNKQYGYKKNHSTELLLTKIVNDLLLACDKKIPTLLMFLDLSAAFDTVDQSILLNILRDEIGIRGIALQWFASFLMGRTQKVKIGDAYSSEDSLDFGVAQGSILGPKLFNIYTRSFPKTMQNVAYSAEGFADDHQLRKQFSLVCQVNALGENLNKAFWEIESWMNKFFLKLNSSKTKIIVVAPPSVQKDIIINGTFINGKCIRFVDCAKNLGVLLDAELSFNKQVNKVISSCFITIRLLTRIKSYLNINQLKTLVSSLVFSKLDYCNILYYGLNSQTIKKLQSVQNSAARLVYKINCFDRVPTHDLFKQLHWLQVKERIVFKVLLVVHKCVIGSAPPDLLSIIRFSASDRTRKLDTQLCNGVFGDRAFSVCGPKLWNALPLHLRMESVTDKFEKSLKTFLFTNAGRFYELVNMK